MIKKILQTAAATAMVGALSASAASAAVEFDVFGSEPGISANVVFTYTTESDATGKFQFDITNTSDGSLNPDSALTAFAFLVPTGDPPSFSGIDTNFGTNGIMASGDINASAWTAAFNSLGFNIPSIPDDLNSGGFTGNTFGGGKVADGIAPGDSASFMIWLTGEDVDLLSESDFDITSTDPYKFAARFQATGDDGEGSDVGVVPLPASLPLLLVGVGGLGLFGWRRSAA